MKAEAIGPLVAAVLAGAVFAGGSEGSAAADGVPVYDATQVAFDGYVIIKRIGIEDWRSAFRLRGHADLATARQAIVNEAARLGADAVTNLTCFDQTDALFKPLGYFCYGNAIRAKK